MPITCTVIIYSRFEWATLANLNWLHCGNDKIATNDKLTAFMLNTHTFLIMPGFLQVAEEFAFGDRELAMDSFAWLDLKATFGYEINKAISLHLFYEPDEDKVTIEYQLCIFHEYHNPQLDHQDFFGVTLGPQSQDRTGASFHRAQHCKTQPSVAPIWCLQNPSRYGN